MRAVRAVEPKLEVRQEEAEAESRAPVPMPIVMALVAVVPVTVVVRLVPAVDVVPSFVLPMFRRSRTRNPERERGDDEAGHCENGGAGPVRTNRMSGRIAVEHAAPPRA